MTVSAGYSKRRREDTVPLRADLAQALRFFLATMAPATQAFRIPNDHKKAAQMFRADVEAAGIAYRDASGLVADFHSLRHTFISNLAASGVHPKTAQQLARHSTITLTMDRYTHSYRGDESEALALLPDLSQPSGQAARATGTEGKVEGPNAPARLALRLARQQGFQATSVDSDGLSPGSGVESQSLVIPAVSAEKQGFGSVCTSGGGPGLQNQWRV